MTPLAELLAAVRAGSTLAWAIIGTAVSGSPEAALREAWNTETRADVLWSVVANVPPQPSPDPWLHRAEHVAHLMHYRGHEREGCTCEPDDETQPYDSCRACCDAIRAAVPCPTWAELTEGGKR